LASISKSRSETTVSFVLAQKYERQGLTLALLVLGVLTDHAHHATAVDDLALVTDLLY
jgi:hypothetical protein